MAEEEEPKVKNKRRRVEEEVEEEGDATPLAKKGKKDEKKEVIGETYSSPSSLLSLSDDVILGVLRLATSFSSKTPQSNLETHFRSN